MEQTLEQILSELLQKQAENPDMDIDTLIAQALADNGVEKEGVEQYNDAADCLDRINTKYNDLVAAKDEGKARGSWLASQLDQTAEKLPEDKRDEFLSKIQESVETADNQIIKED